MSREFWRNSISVIQGSYGASGGIGTFWLESCFKLKACSKSKCWVVIKIEDKNSKQIILKVNVYALVLYSEKGEFWDPLINLKEEQ